MDGAEGPGPPGSRVVDEGLQHERTALAWDRTALALILVAALNLRFAGGAYGELLHVPAYLAVGVGGLLLWLGSRRYRHRERDLRAELSPVRPRLVVLTGVATTLVGLGSLALVVLG